MMQKLMEMPKQDIESAVVNTKTSTLQLNQTFDKAKLWEKNHRHDVEIDRNTKQDIESAVVNTKTHKLQLNQTFDKAKLWEKNHRHDVEIDRNPQTRH